MQAFSFDDFWMVDSTVSLHLLNRFKSELSTLIKDSNLLHREWIYSKNKEHYLLQQKGLLLTHSLKKIKKDIFDAITGSVFKSQLQLFHVIR